MSDSAVTEETGARDSAVAIVEARLPTKLHGRDITRVVVKITGVDDLLEIEGDDVDLGTDLKVRYRHRLVAEFRRDAIDGWWYKDVVLNHDLPFGGEGNAEDVGDVENQEQLGLDDTET